MSRARSLAVILLAVALVIPAVSVGGGLTLYEIGTADVGLASAGWAARAHDPATLLKNPAGMSRVTGNQFQGENEKVSGTFLLKEQSLGSRILRTAS